MAMDLNEVFTYFHSRQTNGVVVTSAGTTCGAWWAVSKDIDRAFYMGASMSMISMIAAGVAYGAPKLPVWAFMGDGSFCMNPGMLMVERDLNLPNFKHFLVSNRVYGATGATRLPNADRNDYAALARSLGIERATCIDNMEQLKAQFDDIVERPGYAFTVLEVNAPDSGQEKGVPIDDIDNKLRFGRYIERTAGVKVFRHPAAPHQY